MPADLPGTPGRDDRRSARPPGPVRALGRPGHDRPTVGDAGRLPWWAAAEPAAPACRTEPARWPGGLADLRGGRGDGGRPVPRGARTAAAGTRGHRVRAGAARHVRLVGARPA